MSRDEELLGSELTLKVEAAASNGRTLSRLPDGRVVWLSGLLCVGDQGRFELTKLRAKSAEARLLELTEPSAQRVEPFCPQVERCGGCPWQAIPDSLQVETLSADLRRSLERATASSPHELRWSAPFVSAERAWRHTARLHLKGQGQGLKLGFYGSEGHLDLAHCPTFSPKLNEALAGFRASALPQLATLGPSLEGELRLSVARGAASGTGALTLKTPLSSAEAEALGEALQRWLSSTDSVHGVALSSPPKLSAQPRSKPSQRRGKGRGPSGPPPKQRPVMKSWGEPYNQLTTPHPAHAFMQAHQEGNEALVEEVVRHAEGARTLLELYAGSGNLSLALAAREPSRPLTCVESDREALEALERAAQERGFTQLKVLRHDLRRPPETLLRDFLGGVHEQLILDPPRAGAKELIARLAELCDERGGRLPFGHKAKITYISCHPAALARDVKVLTEAGWHAREARLFHLFPHTGHAEVCVTLSREV